MKKDYIFNFDKFEKALVELDKGKELNNTEIEAHRIIATISDYIDCESDFLNNITEEGVSKAMEMMWEQNRGLLYGMYAASRSLSVTSDAKTMKRITTEDLF